MPNKPGVPIETQHEEKVRTAMCCCGDTWLTVRGEPERVIICHCIYCQRKTGSVSNNSAWFIEDQIIEQQTNNTSILNDTPGNPGVDYHFCSRCGSTVFWKVTPIVGAYESEHGGEGATVSEDGTAGHIAVSVGAFGDPDFPPPTDEWFYENRHHWVKPTINRKNRAFPTFPTPERVRFDPHWLARYQK